MSVTEYVQVPEQPTVGGVTYHPLGGNGFVSPHSVYHVRVRLTGDASGGAQEVRIRPDVRFTSLVAFCSATLDGAAITADAPVNFVISEEMNSRAEARSPGTYLPIGGEPAVVASWNPPPFLVSAGPASAASADPTLRVRVDNTNGTVLAVYASIYNFDKRAREVVPIDSVLQVLTRSQTLV